MKIKRDSCAGHKIILPTYTIQNFAENCLKPLPLRAVFFRANVTVGEEKQWLPMFKITSFGRIKTKTDVSRVYASIFRGKLFFDQ